jgi:hypothetical protein
MAHWKGMMRRGMRTAGEVGSMAIGAWGSAKALGAMGSEIYGGMQAARAMWTAAGIAAPMAIAAL